MTLGDLTNYRSLGIDTWENDFNIIESYNDITGFNQILIKDVARLSPYGFDLKGTLESGQCFRWKDAGMGKYFGIVRDKAVYVSTIDSRDLLIENATIKDFCNLWYDYFDLATDLSEIIKEVDKDPFMHESILFSGGVRMLRQDFEETLFSYILSAQNNIPRIKGLVETLCKKYGDKIYSHNEIHTLMGYAFPSSNALSMNFCGKDHSNCSSNNLCGHQFAGYRCPYIKKTAIMIDSGKFKADYDLLSSISADKARKILCQLPGVGEKVADCVLLYSGIRKDICPIDTWVEKTIKIHYLGDNASKKEIRAFTESYFAENAGYAQLWFFNYARNQ